MHPLISAAELAERLEEVTVLDVRYRMGGPPGAQEYARGHVAGAVYVDLDADLAAAPHGRDGREGQEGQEGQGRHPLPDPGDLQAAMRRAGVRQDRPVVVYDDWGGRAAARCWWLLRWAGKDDVQVLDGGWPAWNGPVQEGAPASVEPGDLVVRPGQQPALGPDEVRDWDGVLVDARAPERFRGDVEPVDPVAGHVPGAVNVPTETNLSADGRFRPATQIAALYAAGGVDGSAPVAVYCGSGVTACHDVLALELAGIPAVLYPGSWSGWVSDPDRPVATGG
ncbi:sulfurtransferase [Nocardioides mangrovicus]|uniref:Sulfurtransferase n=1 Tax=Nocardioides mangrovicus TaxID=2478913 RepID=A0A3L8P2E8_9ACTN|nr:sulfurtransferase [Nocardioides mangrovicus]RLV49231.1 sulfurtransferase [Nocardioides mangrovicus]